MKGRIIMAVSILKEAIKNSGNKLIAVRILSVRIILVSFEL